MMPGLYSQLFRLARPELAVAITALIVLGVDLVGLRNASRDLRRRVAALISTLGCMAGIHHIVRAHLTASLPDGMFYANPLTDAVQIILLGLTATTLVLAVDSDFTEHIGEFTALVLFSTLGGMFLAASQNILVLFLALELLSLSLYILTGLDKRSARSAEAALKYFLFGGMSAAFLLFGLSLMYGLSNSLWLPQIAATLHGQPVNPILFVAIVTVLIGLAFKIAAAPLHFWAPDVYQAAPAPAAAYTASVSKVASFFLTFQVLTIGFAGAQGTVGRHFVSGWAPALAAIAVLSMLLGNFVAIRQTSVRRLLAYSAVAHAGYMLLATLGHTPQSLAALLYYVVTYSLAILGIFAIVAVVERETGGDSFIHFNGLSRRAPFLSLCLFVFLLSLAGIPPLAGFFGKFYVFIAALRANPGSRSMLALIVLAIAMSAVSLYYYLKVLKRVYVTDPPADASDLRVSTLTSVVIALLAALTILLGCMPQLLLRWLEAAVNASSL